jgi:hypothetical protein
MGKIRPPLARDKARLIRGKLGLQRTLRRQQATGYASSNERQLGNGYRAAACARLMINAITRYVY